MKKFDFKRHYNLALFLVSIFIFLLLLLFLNYSFSIKNIQIDFSDNLSENTEIKKHIEKELADNANTLINFFLLDEKLLTKLTRDEFQVVNKVDFRRGFYFGGWKNFGLQIYAVVVKNSEYFFACVQESDRDNFLVWSMQGNIQGEFYKEVDCEKGVGLKLVLHPKSIYDKEKEERVSGVDSLSGMRVYKQVDFAVLKELVAYLQKNSFQIKEVYVNDLKLAEINITDYVLKVNLEKSATQTIADFQTISKSGKLEKYINDSKSDIEYIDLSFKDKVFYKLKNNTKNDTMSTTTQLQ